MKSDIFGFVEKEDVPYAIEKLSGDISPGQPIVAANSRVASIDSPPFAFLIDAKYT